MIDLQREAQLSLKRLLPRIEPLFKNDADLQVFKTRLGKYFPAIFRTLHAVYGSHYDFFYHLEQILMTTAQAFLMRSPGLRALDVQREQNPLWFKSHEMIGGVCYVDLFAGDLNGIREKIPYFQELGLTYLHLMPLFLCPEDNSDGGYAVSDYRRVNPALGTMEQLSQLADELRAVGISLVLDFVFNHTSDEHEWALNALQGDEHYRQFYYFFPDRAIPDQLEKNLREIFPEQAPGSFTYLPQTNEWVWTTFNNFQWDLNYSNPETFNAMLDEMLFLANQGVEVLRLDAVAFIWKEFGTPCENLPQVHDIIQTYNALARIAAPALLFKSEAIVHPDEVESYVNWQEAPISYNPTYMALLWEALATREIKLLSSSMRQRFQLPETCAWVNYIRVHDDIGWSFADEDAAAVWINGFDHRQFLNRFYTGKFPGSFAAGLPFNFNPVTLDMRISGTAASLAGLEQGISENNEVLIEYGIRRILMLHNMIIAAGGIPLIYIGDEIASLNDYSYTSDLDKAEDSRWVHRPRFDWQRAAQRTDPNTLVGRVFQNIKRMIDIRKATPAFADKTTQFIPVYNDHVTAFVRSHEIMVVANFSEQPQVIDPAHLDYYWSLPAKITDLITGQPVELRGGLRLEGYQYVWLKGG